MNESISLFSIPHGQFDDDVISMCRQAGYSYVYSILPKPVHFTKNEYVRGRIDVDPWDWKLEYFLKLVGAYCWLPRAFSLKRRIRLFFNLEDNLK
jgi:hypothetical protein